MVDHVRDQLVSLLDLRDCRFEYGKLMGFPTRLESDGNIVTRYGRRDAKEFGSPAGEIELRTAAGGRYFGRFMLTPNPGSRPPLQARLAAATLAETVARALAADATAGQ